MWLYVFDKNNVSTECAVMFKEALPSKFLTQSVFFVFCCKFLFLNVFFFSLSCLFLFSCCHLCFSALSSRQNKKMNIIIWHFRLKAGKTCKHLWLLHKLFQTGLWIFTVTVDLFNPLNITQSNDSQNTSAYTSYCKHQPITTDKPRWAWYFQCIFHEFD